LDIFEFLSRDIKLCSNTDKRRIMRTHDRQTGITTDAVKPTFSYAVKVFTGNSL
jgi:hypothetical protein